MVPSVSLGDGFFTIEAVFTKEAVNSFRKQFSHLCFSKMQGRVIKVHKWQFALKQRDRESHHNAHANIAVYLIVKDFQPMPQYLARIKAGVKVTHLFEDPMVKQLVMHHRFREQKTLLQAKESNEIALGFGTLSMPSLHELFRNPKHINSRRICKAGLRRLNTDDALETT
jgi:hypothetical protein